MEAPESLDHVHTTRSRKAGAWTLSPRCKCSEGTDGEWAFEHHGELWTIQPPTQEAKDDWILDPDLPGPEGETARIDALRWECHGCDTIQSP